MPRQCKPLIFKRLMRTKRVVFVTMAMRVAITPWARLHGLAFSGFFGYDVVEFAVTGMTGADGQKRPFLSTPAVVH